MSLNMDHYLSSQNTSLFDLDLEFSLHTASQRALGTNSFDELYEMPMSDPTRMRFDIPGTTSLNRTSTNCSYRRAECG
jgi:hypothetical protein